MSGGAAQTTLTPPIANDSVTPRSVIRTESNGSTGSTVESPSSSEYKIGKPVTSNVSKKQQENQINRVHTLSIGSASNSKNGNNNTNTNSTNNNKNINCKQYFENIRFTRNEMELINALTKYVILVSTMLLTTLLSGIVIGIRTFTFIANSNDDNNNNNDDNNNNNDENDQGLNLTLYFIHFIFIIIDTLINVICLLCQFEFFGYKLYYLFCNKLHNQCKSKVKYLAIERANQLYINTTELIVQASSREVSKMEIDDTGAVLPASPN